MVEADAEERLPRDPRSLEASQGRSRRTPEVGGNSMERFVIGETSDRGLCLLLEL